jgi:hypothetical protein
VRWPFGLIGSPSAGASVGPLEDWVGSLLGRGEKWIVGDRVEIGCGAAHGEHLRAVVGGLHDQRDVVEECAGDAADAAACVEDLPAALGRRPCVPCPAGQIPESAFARRCYATFSAARYR